MLHIETQHLIPMSELVQNIQFLVSIPTHYILVTTVPQPE